MTASEKEPVLREAAEDALKKVVGSSPPKVEHFTPDQRASMGKAARQQAPLESHGEWAPTDYRIDPIASLEEQAQTRVPELVPIRHGRMMVSPFTFYRGAAYIMASDLASTPRSGLRVQACGDAHLSNFGIFASPERDLMFDINDFDETLPAPWEWDVKRLAASFVAAGRDRGFDTLLRREIVLVVAQTYRTAMRAFAEKKNLEVWYAKLDVAAIIATIGQQTDKKAVARLEKSLEKARGKGHLRAFEKLAISDGGDPHIVSDPPLLVPFRDLMPQFEQDKFMEFVRAVLRTYRRTLQGDRKRLLESYRVVDAARKVVGVGSVGTRANVALMLGRDNQDPLFLQMKEAQDSVLAPFAGKSLFKNQGQRVVEGQRLMQATSDIFLGWTRSLGADLQYRDFYMRQLWDAKMSFDTSIMLLPGFKIYAQACGWTLARAHARSGDRIAIGAYMGKKDTFDQAIADFAEAYADQNERDYQALLDAVKSGRLAAQQGV
jgi:uncharacterized protein (DUF2252 family)